MQTAEELKDYIRARYGQIASQDAATNASSCCGVGSSCGGESYRVFSEDYSRAPGYVAEADLGLGCGLPLAALALQPGEVVLDLGSGAGNDAFVARAAVGEEGRVIGVDFTPEMVTKARANAEKLGYANVEFRQGDIENLPVGPARIDVVTSNCVLNLVPDKKRAFAEIFRVLRPGGRFTLSDVVLSGSLPERVRSVAELVAGCVSGALQESEYLGIIHRAGFEDVQVIKDRVIELPPQILAEYLSPEEIVALQAADTQVKSITVVGLKPAGSCGCGTDCC